MTNNLIVPRNTPPGHAATKVELSRCSQPWPHLPGEVASPARPTQHQEQPTLPTSLPLSPTLFVVHHSNKHLEPKKGRRRNNRVNICKECSHPLAFVAKQGKRTGKKKEPIHPSRLISTTTSCPKVGESHLKSDMQPFAST